jgi:cell division transport system permease protein
MATTTKLKGRKKTLGSYPYISVVLSITLALFVIGVFGVLIIYSNELERAIRDNVKIQVFLKNNLTESQRIQVEKNLSSRKFVAKGKPGAIQFVSKDEAAKDVIRETGEDFKPLLGQNPLRDAFHVSIDPAFHDSANMARIKKEVEGISGVFQVYFVENLIESINKNVTKIVLILAGVATALLLTVVLLIHNTLRLALFSQRFLIRSMQLVGATRSFIQWPFLLRAALHGLVAGILASALLFGLISLAHKRIEDLALIQNTNRILILVGGLLILGILVSFFSTYRAVSKYLQLSLDELY